MREHGVSQFPDPRTSVPSNFGLGEYRGLTDFDGAILVWPTTLNMLAPAYTRAAAACGDLARSWASPTGTEPARLGLSRRCPR